MCPPPGLRGFRNTSTEQFGIWLYVLSVQLLVVAMAFETGVSAGWTLYFPLTGIDFSSSHAVSLAILSLHLLGASSEADATTFWQYCS